MRLALEAINDLERAGLIHSSAIGGAMGAMFYLEPFSTLDLDVFVVFQNPPLILTLTPIYDFLKGRGYRPEGDAVKIGEWPVQFLPAESRLLMEAVEQADSFEFEGVPARVMTAEHLMAIALQTGRAKDHARLLVFLSSGRVNLGKLETVLERHDLYEAWQRFKIRFVDTP